MAEDIIKEAQELIDCIDNDPFYSEDKTDIYIITTSDSDSFYIGMSKDAEVRKKAHIHALRKNAHHNKNLQEAFNENEGLNWTVYHVPTRELASEIELYLIRNNIDKPECLNICTDVAPRYTARTHSSETKEKMSASAKKAWTEERKEKQAERQREYWNGITPEQRHIHVEATRKLNEARKEKPEILKSISDSLKEYWSDPKVREDQSQKRKNFFNNGGIHPWLGKTIHPGTNEKLQAGRERFQKSLTEQERIEFNRKRTEKTRIPVQIGDTAYESLSEAAFALGVSPATVRNRINSGKFTDWKMKANS